MDTKHWESNIKKEKRSISGTDWWDIFDCVHSIFRTNNERQNYFSKFYLCWIYCFALEATVWVSWFSDLIWKQASAIKEIHTLTHLRKNTQNHKKSVYIRKMIPKISLLRNVRLRGKPATQDFVDAKQQSMVDMDENANWCSLCEIITNRT